VDLPSSDEELDLILRHVSRQFPEHLARALLPPGTVVTSARWSDTQVTSRQRRLDRALEVVVGGRRRLEHTEWQLEMVADVPFRVYEYNTLTSIALAAETPAGEETPRVQSTVVLMSGREAPWPARGAYRTSPDEEPFSGVTFRIDAVYQRTVAELEARGPLWTLFAPLAVDADPARMNAVLDRLRAAHAPRAFAEMAAALVGVAMKDQRQRGLSESILKALSEEEAMQNPLYLMGEQKGEQKVVARFYERRLQRPLTEGERAALTQRIEKLGVDRLLDVPQELSADALAAWLGDPAAH
jgi:hypothetical protein